MENVPEELLRSFFGDDLIPQPLSALVVSPAQKLRTQSKVRGFSPQQEVERYLLFVLRVTLRVHLFIVSFDVKFHLPRVFVVYLKPADDVAKLLQLK